ncbi:bifunctional 4-hydroxy-2-oxoglutarate aldolase/2-dehydro-3-deoxy-phosphogluconate aldolase [Daejeonella sp.]|uniref:bifunctional 4-hydroxy-2-oxoglutarate aldolase/2-dehydro-3-deoxy-phosphogluconate aldolase n=1 Tax=Daejeonella sp. TaxID=2805397 RepID=UPI0030C54FE1
MNKKSELLKLIPEQGIVPLYYSDDPVVSIELMRALYHAGIRTTEYADRGEAAMKNFKEMRKACDSEMPGMYLGIGTIKNVDSAKAYIEEGAEFLVSPGIFEPVIEISDKNNLLCIPGCMTPTEIIQAEKTGVTIVKLFPANTLGPSYIEAVQALFPGISFLPTGGIELNAQNLISWFKSGVCAVGGSKLITKDIISNRLYSQLTEDAAVAFQLINTIKSDLKNSGK